MENPILYNVPTDLLEALKSALLKIQVPELNTDAWSLNILREISQKERLVVHAVLPTFGLPSEKIIALQIKKVLVEYSSDPEKVDLFIYSDVKPAAVQSIKNKDIADVRNVILVCSGKGGVGKSTIASNLAVTLAGFGCRVGLLDADIYGPSIPIMFGVTRKDEVKGFVDNDVTYMVPPIKYDVALMSIGFLVDTESAMIWRGPMIASASMQMFYNVYWGQLDYLIVDLPPGTGDIQLTIAQKVNVAGAIIVSTPQDVALSDVVRAKKMFDKVNIPTLGLIENMSYFVCDKCDARHEIFSSNQALKQAELLGINTLGQIPLATDIRSCADLGKPAVLMNNKIMKELMVSIGQNICAQLTMNANKNNLPSNVTLNNPKKDDSNLKEKRRLPTL
jgi:ATP-binding protein involved in chromosome partitioning